MKYFKVIFKRSFLCPIINTLLILSTLLSVSACNNGTTTSTTNPPENSLAFDDFFIHISLKDQDIPTQIHVMISNDSPLPPVIDQISAEAQTKLDAVDFSQNFILFAFMGYQGVTGPTIKITKIWQINNTIYVEAYFDKGGPTYQPASSSPVNIVKVSKENMIHFSEITFILLDQDGKERAIATCEIPE